METRISNKELLINLENELNNIFKPKIDVGYNHIQDNTKSCFKKRKIWKDAITSEIAKKYWYEKFKNLHKID